MLAIGMKILEAESFTKRRRKKSKKKQIKEGGV